MHIVIVYESVYGNTHLIAEAIGDGLRPLHEVAVVPVGHATQQLIDDADLVVVGGPTHVHAMSRDRTREAGVQAAHEPGTLLSLDPDAEGPGLRAWFDSIRSGKTRAAAFDTRTDLPSVVTGRASKGISRALVRRGFCEVAEPVSFLVTKRNTLAAGQQASARLWGAKLSSILSSARAPAM
ncbi:flavodoxin family protein [soil metagenome]|jgi:hypothetical protein